MGFNDRMFSDPDGTRTVRAEKYANLRAKKQREADMLVRRAERRRKVKAKMTGKPRHLI